MNKDQVHKLLGNLIPNFFEINVVARDEIIRVWEAYNFCVHDLPMINVEENTWSFKQYSDILNFPFDKHLQVLIVSFLMKPRFEYYGMDSFVELSFGMFSRGLKFGLYGEHGDYMFPSWREDLRKLDAQECMIKYKPPIIEIDIYPRYIRYYGQMNTDELEKAITNHFMGTKKDTYFRLIPRSEYTINKSHTLTYGSMHANYLNLDSDWNLGNRQKYYLIYVIPPPIMWSDYAQRLMQQGLPKDYVDRISQRQKDQLCNFGHVLSPICNSDTWGLSWDYSGPIPLELEPKKQSRKRKRSELMDLSLVEISPSFFMSESEIENIPGNTIRGPKWLTRKDMPIHRYDDAGARYYRTWTGRSKYYRTWHYEATFTDGRTIYIPQGKISQKRYINCKRGFYGNVRPNRDAKILKDIFKS